MFPYCADVTPVLAHSAAVYTGRPVSSELAHGSAPVHKLLDSGLN